jgi:transcriptional regulator with XRE-family HTH domain
MSATKTKNCRCCDGSGKEIDHKAMGKQLRAEREKLDMSLTYVAGRIGISKAYLHDLESGKRYWTDAKLSSYRAVLKL